MGSQIELTASDGHAFSAYRADPEGTPRAAVVIIQEVFGVNDHVRGVCDAYAADGYSVVAPALFDRAERNVELGYDQDQLARGREIRGALGWDEPLLDVAAALAHVRSLGKVATIGYCWGGSVAWLSATRLDVDAAVGYYGGQIIDFVEETPRCPVLLHFGETDAFIPMQNVELIRAKHAEIPLYTYPAGHGFNCESRADYDQKSANLARERTLAFIREHAG